MAQWVQPAGRRYAFTTPHNSVNVLHKTSQNWRLWLLQNINWPETQSNYMYLSALNDNLNKIAVTKDRHAIKNVKSIKRTGKTYEEECIWRLLSWIRQTQTLTLWLCLVWNKSSCGVCPVWTKSGPLKTQHYRGPLWGSRYLVTNILLSKNILHTPVHCTQCTLHKNIFKHDMTTAVL